MNYKKKHTLLPLEIVVKKSGKNFTRPKPIKPFKTLEEEAEFWDTHDTSKLFDDPKTPLSELLLIKPEKDVVMTIRVQKAVKDKIEKVAQTKGLNSTTLSRMWLVDRLIKEEGDSQKFAF